MPVIFRKVDSFCRFLKIDILITTGKNLLLYNKNKSIAHQPKTLTDQQAYSGGSKTSSVK